MKAMFPILLLTLLLSIPVQAAPQLHFTQSVITPEEGRLVSIEDYWLLAFSHAYDIRLSTQAVSTGQQLTIEVRQDDQWHKESFQVKAISIHQDLCRLHARHPSQDGYFPGDTIYLQPCRTE
ncbi:hypothetical protein [Photobacterium atrarenae]|uniref:DUF3757 domain-containing protein n=1 Tax=Photobacterium atrarenae TaxID=865757 RepID=A0ABY5GKF9_9GAMM|nr:hypothetical protein [Photobacterium atrarenae]UTV29626.1 hypothetical protein NNL38_21685 [Photobacterium atrarenae]